MDFLYSTLHQQIRNNKMLPNTYHIKNKSWFRLQGEIMLAGCIV